MCLNLNNTTNKSPCLVLFLWSFCRGRMCLSFTSPTVCIWKHELTVVKKQWHHTSMVTSSKPQWQQSPFIQYSTNSKPADGVKVSEFSFWLPYREAIGTHRDQCVCASSCTNTNIVMLSWFIFITFLSWYIMLSRARVRELLTRFIINCRRTQMMLEQIAGQCSAHTEPKGQIPRIVEF